MTIEMQMSLEREMNDALAITDDERRNDATRTCIIHQMAALIDCQRKTAERVKVLYEAHERRKWLIGVVGAALTSGFGFMAWLANKIGALANG